MNPTGYVDFSKPTKFTEFDVRYSNNTMWEGKFEHSKRGEMCKTCERAKDAHFKCPIVGEVETMGACNHYMKDLNI